MRLVVGLGNSGTQYADTRHNAGRRLIDFIAAKHALEFSKKKSLKASVSSFVWEGQDVTLARPETFMNLSGEAVSCLVRHFEIEIPKDLLILVDDMALPFGRIRLRSKGTDGGHNGLKSVEQTLQTQAYARLRLGIGGRDAEKSAPLEDGYQDYVLSPFAAAERRGLEAFLKKGETACRLWITQPVEAAMNIVNAGEITS